uniref:Uncharacterized protein n=1 Tax=Trichobilharzia regenti TaxID=157069 RepID=A0AA85K0F6_TRIRE|nr:unnamed protein product [Trichobilharzia regenti]
MRSKSDKYESKTYQGNKNTAADNVDPAAYSSSATITGYYAGKNESEIKSMNYDTLPPLPKFHETTPEYYSENEKKYTNGRDVEDGNDNDDGNDDNDSSMKSLIKGFQSTSLSSNNTNLSKYRTNQNRSPLVKQFSVPKHHADPLYEKHHIVLEEKALTNTAGNAGQHSHHSHHHHHHHHHGNHHHHHHHHGHSNKTRSSRILSPSSTKSLQPKDANNQPEDKEDSAMWSRGPGSANLTTTSASSTGRKSQGHTVYDSRDKNIPSRGDISSASNSGQSSLHSTVNRQFLVNRNTTQSGDTSSIALSEASSLSPNAYTNQQGTEPKSIQTVHSRFRQFWVETFVGGRSRTKSENQTPVQAEAHKVRFSDRLNEPTGQETDILPPHAYTITGDSSQAASILRPLAVYTNLSSPQSDQISPGFISSGTGSLRHLVSKHPRGGVDGVSITPPFSFFNKMINFD